MSGHAPDFDTTDAACKGVDMEFPERDDHRKIGVALEDRASKLKSYCLRCPLIEECRAWALANADNAFGHVAGGLTPSERRKRRAPLRRTTKTTRVTVRTRLTVRYGEMA